MQESLFLMTNTMYSISFETFNKSTRVWARKKKKRSKNKERRQNPGRPVSYQHAYETIQMIKYNFWLTWLYLSSQFSSSHAANHLSILSVTSFLLKTSSFALMICSSILANSSKGSTNPIQKTVPLHNVRYSDHFQVNLEKKKKIFKEVLNMCLAQLV